MTDRAKLLTLFGDRGIRLVVGLANTAVIARTLSPADVGVYAAALVFAAAVDSVASLGIPSVLPSRLAVSAPARRLRALGMAVGLRIGAIAAALVLVVGWTLHTRGGRALGDPRFVALAGLLLAHAVVGDAFLQGIGRPERGAISKSSVAVVFFGARLVAARAGGVGLLGFVLLYAGEQACLSAVNLALCWASDRDGPPAAGPAWRWRELLRYATPMWLSQVATLVYMRADQLVLARVATPEALARYAIAVQFVEQAYTIPVIVNAIAVSKMGAARARSAEEFHSVMVRTYRTGLLLSISCAGVLAAGAPWLMTRLFGSAYAPAAPLAAMLSLTIPMVALGTIQVGAIFTGPKPQIHLTKTCLTALLTPPFAIAGWVLGGSMGLAVSTVTLQVGSCFLMNFWIDRESFRQQVEGIRSLVPWTPR